MRAIRVGIALALSATMLSSAGAAEKYVVDRGVWGAYQEYLGKIGNGRRMGAFVITKDGLGASYSWCPETHCRMNSSASQDALNSCERHYGVECVVFAVRDEIRVDYELAN